MASTIQVDKIQDQGGNTIVESNGSGVFSGSLTSKPAFQAYLSGTQTVVSGTTTKITMDTEDFDTDLVGVDIISVPPKHLA